MSPVAVGLDLSLTGTGIARIESSYSGLCHCQADDPILTHPHILGSSGCMGSTVPLVRTQRVGSDAAGLDVPARARRLRRLAAEIVYPCEGADLALVESPAQSSRSGSAHDRGGLWWLIVERLDRLGIPVAEVAPQHLWMYATGVGKGGKDAVLAAVIRRYGNLVPDLATNDEADGLVLAAMAWHRLTGTPLVPLPATHTRTLDRIRWPSNERTHPHG